MRVPAILALWVEFMKTISTQNLKDRLRDSQHLAAQLSVNASSIDRPHYARSIIFISEALNQIDSLFDSVELPEPAEVVTHAEPG